ncbi:MAG TPA: DUF262 domain-containing protein [Bryocella sp.]|nr:DUF262 domain-containing protein [Bryocella sp.]
MSPLFLIVIPEGNLRLLLSRQGTASALPFLKCYSSGTALIERFAMEKPDRSSYSVLDFMEWKSAGTLEVTPKFQRRSVWKSPARGFLMDTLIKGMPVPPIYLRKRQSDDFKQMIREVIDGQQRIMAVTEFIAGKYAISKNLRPDKKPAKFAQLPLAEQDAIRNYSFICEIVTGISDEEVLQMFARLNTYAVQLSKQELRNGRWFGQFKQTAYKLSFEHIEFWRNKKLFSEQKIARMLEAELTSELLIAMIAGMQDKKESIDDFYEKYDENFPKAQDYAKKFRAVMTEIDECLGTDLSQTAFRRPPLFYTLFCVIYHHRFGLPNTDPASPKVKMREAEQQGLRDAVIRFSEALDQYQKAAKTGEQPKIPKRDAAFVNASVQQTDNIQPRDARFDALYHASFE